MPAATEKSPHFFDREADGSVRLRLRFTKEEADLIEEAAGRSPLVPWIIQAVVEVAEDEAAEARSSRPQVRPE